MADVETPAAAPAPAAPAPAEKPADSIGPMSVPTEPEAYAEWRQTGKLPDTPDNSKPSKREAPASSKSVDDKSEKVAPVSETGKQQGRPNAEDRIKQLASDRDSWKKRAEALEAGKKDATPDSSPGPAKDAKADSSSAPEGLSRPVEPKQEDFDSWDKYKAAERQYIEDLAEFKAAELFEKRERQQQQKAQTQEMQKRLDEAKERYGAEAEPKIIETAKTVFDDKAVAPALKIAMGRSEVLVDALYVMGSDAEEFADYLQLAKSDPLEALRKWFTVEALVKEELGKGSSAKPTEGAAPARGTDGKFLSDKPAKKLPPAPRTELNGNASPPGDERERAVTKGDFRSFKADADRRDMARLRGN